MSPPSPPAPNNATAAIPARDDSPRVNILRRPVQSMSSKILCFLISHVFLPSLSDSYICALRYAVVVVAKMLFVPLGKNPPLLTPTVAEP